MISLAFVLCFVATAVAHFQLNVNIRVIHIEHLEQGLRVYLRLPAPYVLAQMIGEEGEEGLPAPAPYTYNRIEGDQLQHYIDFDALAEDPIGLGELAVKGHRLTGNGVELAPMVEQVGLHSSDDQPPFATLAEAKAAFAVPLWQGVGQEVYVGDTVLDVLLTYPSSGSVYDVTLSSQFDPGLEKQDETANLIIDHFPGSSQVFRITGLMAEPVKISHSPWAAAWTFVVEGVRHILEGTDHVLFVVCLTLGALSLGSLLWLATGFTVGHSVTLAMGFFGLLPTAPWFVPGVETGIALSIIYMAVLALAQKESRFTIIVTAFLGLLHGMGFSFVLREILQVDGPDVWQSLLAFNVGVEVGQVLIILVLWPVFYLVRTGRPKLWPATKIIVAVPCIVVAAMWTGQRAVMFMNAL
ncbi:MAG: HupE/UreJ family protein [Pseudomonadota bacterium]